LFSLFFSHLKAFVVLEEKKREKIERDYLAFETILHSLV
jgi:hypothetical protein